MPYGPRRPGISPADASAQREASPLPLSLLLSAVLLGGVLLIAVAAFHLLAPEAYFAPPDTVAGFPAEPMREAVAVSRVQAQHAEILTYGSRFMGQPGFYETASHIRRAFLEAGLEVHVQSNKTVTPVTAHREVSVIDPAVNTGVPLSDVQVYPMLPNHMHPVVTPEEGITGTLVLLDADTLAARERFDDCIGVIDAQTGHFNEDMGFGWQRYAQLGIKAIILTNGQGLDQLRWDKVVNSSGGSSMVTSIPVNYVRLVADPGILRHLGRTVQVKARVDYRNVPNETIYGVLRAPKPTSEALVVTSHYDACSHLPDRAYGVIQAISPALQLQILEGLLPYRESLHRDVIFVSFGARFMSADGVNNLLRLLEFNGLHSPRSDGTGTSAATKDPRMRNILNRQIRNDRRLSYVETALPLFTNPEFLRNPQHTQTALDALSPASRDFFEEQFAYVLNSIVFEISEPALQARIAFVRDLTADNQSSVFHTYQVAKREYDRVASSAGMGIANLLRNSPAFCADYAVRERAFRRFQKLRSYHLEVRSRLTSDAATLQAFQPYSRIAILDFTLAPLHPNEDTRHEILSYDTGELMTRASSGAGVSLMSAARERLGISSDRLEIPPFDRWQSRVVDQHLLNTTPSRYVNAIARFGYPLYRFVNFQRHRSYRDYAAPTDEPWMHDLASLRDSFSVVGEVVLSMAHGSARFDQTQVFSGWEFGKSFGGRVLVSNVGKSIVPDYPLENALVGPSSVYSAEQFNLPGFQSHLFCMTNPYGEFEVLYNANQFAHAGHIVAEGGGFTPVVAGFGEDGLIHYMKDEGEDGQRLFKSVSINVRDPEEIMNMTIVTFRADPVMLMDLINPQTLKEYTGVRFIRREGLSVFRKQCVHRTPGIHSIYLEPDKRFFVELQSGAPDNELVQTTRAFLLGVDEVGRFAEGEEIAGDGFLVADHPVLLDLPSEAARSMASVNTKRLHLQNTYHMTDERTNEYHRKSLNQLEAASKPGLSKQQWLQAAREAVTYATLVHPVLRESIFEAVLGILWYLFLLVPFIFFFEKLVFCYADVRKQLAAQAGIFLLVFTLLRILHPAFEMVRSSMMILLGFIIIIVSGGITLIFSSKFNENFEELRKRRGKVDQAEVNALGVLGSAFMLGLNNMHRRKVRSGLTCASLVLLTFAMISFTSTRNELVDETTALGKAPYEGMLIRPERFQAISPGELFAVQNRFGQRYVIAPRVFYVGFENRAERKRYNPNIEVSYFGDNESRTLQFDSIIRFNHNEPLRTKIRLLTKPFWFAEHDGEDPQLPVPVIIPDEMAEVLGITIEAVNRDSVPVKINGGDFIVKGIFDSEDFANLRDLDGHDLLPFDIETLESVGTAHGRAIAEIDAPRIAADRVVVLPMKGGDIQIQNAQERRFSIAIAMPDASYREAKQSIETYMEQTASTVFFGLDGFAYRGRRARELTVSGLVDLAIPLIIAVLTVLNTMKGSIHERRDEIYVYNSVGIAPRCVFFLFFAESSVYVVVGSLLGFLLSQGTGRILTLLDLTGGLHMTFTSVFTIYTSIAIAAAVFLSTYFPARTAMEIATPAEDAGWSLPVPTNGTLKFDLPFNFREAERLAILEFVDRHLREHGEGGSGRFHANVPVINVEEDEASGDAPWVPCLRATVWLKPFDLGVSQQLKIRTPEDPQTGLYKASLAISHLSGKRESWLRLNKSFVATIRRHLLHWRTVDETDREEMFEEARRKIKSRYSSPGSETAGP